MLKMQITAEVWPKACEELNNLKENPVWWAILGIGALIFANGFLWFCLNYIKKKRFPAKEKDTFYVFFG